ncbi:MAG TPA: hypothetical protein VGG49_13375 [Steroidobacteraceae bacterium]|jgi:hypothetical protein
MAETNQQAAVKAEAAQPARLIAPINADRLSFAESSMCRWRLVLHAGTEPDDILPVSFWANLASSFGPPEKADQVRGSEVVVLTEDMKWTAVLIVVDYGANWAKLVFQTTAKGERLITQLGGLQRSRVVHLPGHTVNYGGVFGKWRVVRDIDGAVLRDKFSTEGEAHGWLAEYAKSIAA